MSEHDREYDEKWSPDALVPASFRSEAGRTGSEDTSALFRTVVGVQTGWTLLVLGLLFAVDELSLESGFVLSFLGLLGVRLLFAPTRETPDWWRVLNWVVYAGFVVLGYIFSRDLALVPA